MCGSSFAGHMCGSSFGGHVCECADSFYKILHLFINNVERVTNIGIRKSAHHISHPGVYQKNSSVLFHASLAAASL